MRGAALNVGVNRNTATNIIRVSGYVRRCRTCGKPITGNRFWYCSNGCQEWKKKQRERVVQPKTPLYDATANILRTLELGSCDDHVSLALKAAEDISERNAAYYLGAAYEGIADACLEGITDEEELLSRAKDSIKRQWKETITWAKSLDGLKDACGYEPSVMLE
jgi:predicted nucleic acid-binding Zn ribbon protein